MAKRGKPTLPLYTVPFLPDCTPFQKLKWYKKTSTPAIAGNSKCPESCIHSGKTGSSGVQAQQKYCICTTKPRVPRFLEPYIYYIYNYYIEPFFRIHIFNIYFSGIVVQNPSTPHFYCIFLYHLLFFVVREE